MDCSSGVLLKKRRVDATVSQASPGLLENSAMFHREIVDDILGDDGLRILEGAMESLVEEHVASSSHDVINENLQITSDEDTGDTQVTDATFSCSSESITAGSSSSLLTPPNCLNGMMTGSWTPSSATEVLETFLFLDSVSGISSSGRRIGIIHCIAVNSLKADYNIHGHAKKCKLHTDITGKFCAGRCDGHSLVNSRHSSHS